MSQDKPPGSKAVWMIAGAVAIGCAGWLFFGGFSLSGLASRFQRRPEVPAAEGPPLSRPIETPGQEPAPRPPRHVIEIELIYAHDVSDAPVPTTEFTVEVRNKSGRELDTLLLDAVMKDHDGVRLTSELVPVSPLGIDQCKVRTFTIKHIRREDVLTWQFEIRSALSGGEQVIKDVSTEVVYQ